MRKLFSIIIASAISLSIMAKNDTTTVKAKYTGEDFFNALTLPAEVGLAFQPGGVQEMGILSKMSLEWRWKNTYGGFALLEYSNFDSWYGNREKGTLLAINGSNALRGEARYANILLGGGYRLPLVKDIRAYKANPTYDNIVSLGFYLEAGATITHLKNVKELPIVQNEILSSSFVNIDSTIPYYELVDTRTAVPTVKMAVELEWLLNRNLCIFVSGGYVQHIVQTPLEKAANTWVGSVVTTIGLTTFF